MSQLGPCLPCVCSVCTACLCWCHDCFVMSVLFATTVACIWGSRKNMSFDICSLITLMKPYLDRFRVLLVGLTSEV